MPGAEDGSGGVMGTYCLMGTESQFSEVKIQEIDDGESCTFTFNNVNSDSSVIIKGDGREIPDGLSD